ncbi:SDR family oxidoreductase [Arenibacter sp. GZD96]|uniref:SDR family oxidoreductase n=1 Tax=Aurantibrevibacter litoralis TaxID=3106030 RepID=UPI002AFE9531|nr:SDR family oxidoreductase [Arenibacter sp. GZD-96]MEA1786271.1 SDR family oxidoreductase [Arenibacter sp. GZD-96]
MTRIDGKTVWITGASSGIGEALTYKLNRKGCQLIISSRNEKELLRVKHRCLHPDLVFVLPLDLAAFDAMEAKANVAIAAFGKIDILVNNGGMSQRSLIKDASFEVFKKLIDVNYLGTIGLTKALLPYFLKQKSGHIVTITSLMGKFGTPYRSGYCGAKHALHGFFDVLRMEHEKDGLKVTLICPGFVKTKVAMNALSADGTPQLIDDGATANGLPVDDFTQKMIGAMEREKFEVYIGKKEVMGIYLKRFFPKLLHKIVLKSKVV